MRFASKRGRKFSRAGVREACFLPLSRRRRNPRSLFYPTFPPGEGGPSSGAGGRPRLRAPLPGHLTNTEDREFRSAIFLK